MDQAVLIALGRQRHVVDDIRRVARDFQALVFAGLEGRRRHGVGHHGRIDMALGDGEDGVVLGLVGTEGPAAPSLLVLLQGDGFIGAAGVTDVLALEVFVLGYTGVVAGQHHHLEGEVRNGHGHGFGAFQGVGGRGDDHVGTPGDQCGNTIRERRFDHLGGHPQHFRQVVAVIDVESDRVVLVIARAHGREIQCDRAAQFAGVDDVIELVGKGGVDNGRAHDGEEGYCKSMLFHRCLDGCK